MYFFTLTITTKTKKITTRGAFIPATSTRGARIVAPLKFPPLNLRLHHLFKAGPYPKPVEIQAGEATYRFEFDPERSATAFRLEAGPNSPARSYIYFSETGALYQTAGHLPNGLLTGGLALQAIGKGSLRLDGVEIVIGEMVTDEQLVTAPSLFLQGVCNGRSRLPSTDRILTDIVEACRRQNCKFRVVMCDGGKYCVQQIEGTGAYEIVANHWGNQWGTPSAAGEDRPTPRPPARAVNEYPTEKLMEFFATEGREFSCDEAQYFAQAFGTLADMVNRETEGRQRKEALIKLRDALGHVFRALNVADEKLAATYAPNALEACNV
jgi:hypothetical protein